MMYSEHLSRLLAWLMKVGSSDVFWLAAPTIAGAWFLLWRKQLKPRLRKAHVFGKRVSEALGAIEKGKTRDDVVAEQVTAIQGAIEESAARAEDMSTQLNEIYRRAAVHSVTYRMLASLLNTAIVERDKFGRFLWASPTWYEWTGLTEEDAHGNGWINGIHSDDRQRVDEEWIAALRDQRKFISQYRLQHIETRKETMVRVEEEPIFNGARAALAWVGKKMNVAEAAVLPVVVASASVRRIPRKSSRGKTGTDK